MLPSNAFCFSCNSTGFRLRLEARWPVARGAVARADYSLKPTRWAWVLRNTSRTQAATGQAARGRGAYFHGRGGFWPPAAFAR